MVSYKKNVYCSSKSFFNFRLSSTTLLINWFLIKIPSSSKSFLNIRLSSTRLLRNWFLKKNVHSFLNKLSMVSKAVLSFKQ